MEGGAPVDTGQPFLPDLTLLPTFLEGVSAMGDEEAAALEAPITLSEVQAAVEECENNKSPGLDGITFELYKCTLNTIGPKLVQIFNSMLREST